MKKLALLSAVALSIVACKNDAKEEAKPVQETTENVVEVIQKPEVKLYTFDGGHIKVNNLNLFAQGDTYKGETIDLANAFYVIKHPKGNLLWDAGLPENLVGQEPYTSPDKAFTVTRKDSIVNQLNKIDLKPSDVNYIAFSHLHFDHTGPANHFADATWLVQQPEYEFSQGEEIKSNGFYSVDAIAKLNKVQQLHGDHDVFGDGTVIIKSMPGHTPGHQVLFLNLTNNGPILLSGDLYHFGKNRTGKIVPQFNHDIPETEKSIAKFEDFAKQNNAKVYIQHEVTDFAKMPKAPKYMN
ncbi:N-acyl homoserine lactonase family protein [Aquimarina rhabdastrellae]